MADDKKNLPEDDQNLTPDQREHHRRARIAAEAKKDEKARE